MSAAACSRLAGGDDQPHHSGRHRLYWRKHARRRGHRGVLELRLPLALSSRCVCSRHARVVSRGAATAAGGLAAGGCVRRHGRGAWDRVAASAAATSAARAARRAFFAWPLLLETGQWGQPRGSSSLQSRRLRVTQDARLNLCSSIARLRWCTKIKLNNFVGVL